MIDVEGKASLASPYMELSTVGPLASAIHMTIELNLHPQIPEQSSTQFEMSRVRNSGAIA